MASHTPRRLRFRSDFHIEVLPGEGVLLLSEQGHVHLSGTIFELLAPLLNGRNTEEQLSQKLKDKAPLEELYYGLEILRKKGCIIETDSNVSIDIAAFCSSPDINSGRAKENLRVAGVSVHVFGDVDKKQLISALGSLRIRIMRSGLAVVLTDDYLRSELRGWNRKMLRSSSPWMLIKPVGKTIWVGPIFVPSRTGCWECLSSRLRGHREVEEFVEKSKNTLLSIPKPSLPSTINVAVNLAATEILRWLVEKRNDRLEGKVITLNTTSLELSVHVLKQRPQCRVCGNPVSKNKTTAPVILRTNPGLQKDHDFLRAASPEETIRKYEDQISPITGVISRLVRSSPQNCPVHVYLAGHNSAMKTQKLHILRRSLRSNSSGKGKTDAIARASAIGEAIERYSGNFAGDEIKITATLTELRASAIDPALLLLYSKKQYQNRKVWNALNRTFQFIPEPFDPEAKIEWTPVWSLTHSKFKFVPTAFCYYGYPQKANQTFCIADSNGNASGNTMEEAILHGFLELAERDSVAIWWYNRLRRPGVDLMSFSEPYYDDLKRFYGSIHREFWVLDLTSDLNIPSFVAVTRKINGKAEEIGFGFGAHMNARIAVLRAVTEMAQMLPNFNLLGNGHEEYDYDDPDTLNWWRTATMEQHPYLLPDARQRPRQIADYVAHSSNDLRDDVLHCVQIAREHRMEVLVLDQTRPDIGMPVAKVIVPGLRHFWARFAPGRLYDVPVRQRWLKLKKLESEMNPTSIFV